MEAFMLEGWTPILLTGVIAAIIIFLLSRKTSRKTLLIMSIVLSVLCVVIVFISMRFPGGWEGIGIAYVTFTSFLGIWAGTILGLMMKK